MSIRYTERLAEAGIEPSVGSRGDSYDNALVETIIGLFKTEVIHRDGPWRGPDAVEMATLEWVSWFNTIRLLEPLGYLPPAEFLAEHQQQVIAADFAAVHSSNSVSSIPKAIQSFAESSSPNNSVDDRIQATPQSRYPADECVPYVF
jgi:hypothetical protein